MTPVLIRQAIFGDGSVIPSSFSLYLVDIYNKPRVCFQLSTKAPITEHRDVSLSHGDVTIHLVPQEDIVIPTAAGAVYYRIDYDLGGVTDSFLFTVTDSVTTVDLMDLIGLKAIPTLFTDLVLQQLQTILATPINGDMTKAVYDPQLILADAFSRVNHTGTQLLSTISDAGSAAASDVTDFASATALFDHKNDQANPHMVTAVQAGADPAGSAAAVSTDLGAHTARTDNPHSVTATQLGLGNVDNTSDSDKPISSATLAALNTKASFGLVIALG